MQLSLEENPERLDIGNAIISFLLMSTEIFFDIVMGYCKIGSTEILCFRNTRAFSSSDIHKLPEIMIQLKNLKIDESYKVKIANDFVSHLKMRKPVQNQFDFNDDDLEPSEFVNVKITEMYERYRNISIGCR